VKRFVSPDGPINAPWGIVQAGANFGPFSNDILIADAGGDGRVSAFDPNTGGLAGQIMDGTGNPPFFVGMHALAFRADGIGDANTLYYVDGAAEGATPHGSFSTITTGRAAFMAFTFFNTTLRAAAFPGDPIVLTASIDTRSGTPTGTVVFVDTCCTLNPPVTQTTLGTVSLVDGTAAVTTAFAAGDHVISASYSGDANFVPSSRSSTLAVLFNIQTTLRTPSSATSGTPVLLSANVASIPAVQLTSISGQIAFLDGNLTLGTVPVLAGAAQLSLN